MNSAVVLWDGACGRAAKKIEPVLPPADAAKIQLLFEALDIMQDGGKLLAFEIERLEAERDRLAAEVGRLLSRAGAS